MICSILLLPNVSLTSLTFQIDVFNFSWAHNFCSKGKDNKYMGEKSNNSNFFPTQDGNNYSMDPVTTRKVGMLSVIYFIQEGNVHFSNLAFMPMILLCLNTHLANNAKLFFYHLILGMKTIRLL